MFASKTRARCAIAFHAWLIAVIFFNALAPITVAASSLSEKDQPKTDTVKIDNASVEDVPAYQERLMTRLKLSHRNSGILHCLPKHLCQPRHLQPKKP